MGNKAGMSNSEWAKRPWTDCLRNRLWAAMAPSHGEHLCKRTALVADNHGSTLLRSAVWSPGATTILLFEEARATSLPVEIVFPRPACR